MRAIYTIIFIGVLAVFSGCSSKDTAKQEDFGEHNDKIKELLSKMSIEEKVGQMTQITLDVVSETNAAQHTFQMDMLRKVIVDYKVGSILNVSGNPYTKEHWYEVIKTIQDLAGETPNKIPVIYGIDAIHGVNYTLGTTLFPQQIAQAATWSPELVERGGAITAYETRASGIPWNFSPVLDMGRNPVWPRFWETFGEDVYLATKMAQAITFGYQGNDVSASDKVAACAKHYMGYSFPLRGKDRTQAWIPENYLREYFLPTFKAAVDKGILTFMINSGEINGIPVHASKHILTDILRTELGFKGLAVSDWKDIRYLYIRHRVAASEKEAVKMAVMAGIDMSMVPNDLSFADYLLELVKEGEVPMWRIDQAVSRILYVKLKLGLFEKPVTNPADYPDFGSEKFRKESFATALEAITLLKNNDRVLPLDSNKRVLVTGPTAHSMRALNGGWSYTWQGEKTEQFTEAKNTILEAIKLVNGEKNVTYVEGTDFEKEINIEKAVSAARNADVVILCLGENSYTEKPGDINDLNISDPQIKLALELAKAGKPIVLVLVEGRPRIIQKIEPVTSAVVMAYLPGNEGGDAIADILFGKANPSGKLPFTYPRFANDLVTYDHKFTDAVSPWEDEVHDEKMTGFSPQFEFGFGLSYTTFEYSDFKVSAAELTNGDSIQVSVTVANTGKMAGKEVVQLYVTDMVASITPSVKRLRGFSKITLQAGETKSVNFTLKATDLAFVNAENKWVTEPGEFKITVKQYAQNIFVK